MEIKINWEYVQDWIDTKEMELICLPARGERRTSAPEIDASLCIKDGFNLCISNIHTGDKDSSNALCQEIVRRFNEFPEDLKR